MAFNPATLGVDRTVIKQIVSPTVIGGLIQTFTVTGALTTDTVEAQIIGTGGALSITPIAARISATNTVELTLGTALAFDVLVTIKRNY